MQEAGGELLTSRVLVRTDLSYRAMRVDLAGARASRGADASIFSADPLPQVLRATQLVDLAESLAVEGLLLRGEGAALGPSGLRQVLGHLRARFAGWIALQTRGVHPDDLRAMLAAEQLDLVDLQMAWVENDAALGRRVVRLAPYFRRAQSVLCSSSCRCVLRFTSPAEGEVFSKVSPVFDAFVRNSPEPVAVQVLESNDLPAGSDVPANLPEAFEFVACRPASMVTGHMDWWNLQPRQRQANEDTDPQRGMRLRF